MESVLQFKKLMNTAAAFALTLAVSALLLILISRQRVTISLDLSLDNAIPLLAKVPRKVSKIFSGYEKLHLSTCHIAEVKSSAVKLEMAFWLWDLRRRVKMDLKQQVLLAVLGRLEQLGVGLYMPITTVVLEPGNYIEVSENAEDDLDGLLGDNVH